MGSFMHVSNAMLHFPPSIFPHDPNFNTPSSSCYPEEAASPCESEESDGTPSSEEMPQLMDSVQKEEWNPQLPIKEHHTANIGKGILLKYRGKSFAGLVSACHEEVATKAEEQKAKILSLKNKLRHSIKTEEELTLLKKQLERVKESKACLIETDESLAKFIALLRQKEPTIIQEKKIAELQSVIKKIRQVTAPIHINDQTVDAFEKQVQDLLGQAQEIVHSGAFDEEYSSIYRIKIRVRTPEEKTVVSNEQVESAHSERNDLLQLLDKEKGRYQKDPLISSFLNTLSEMVKNQLPNPEISTIEACRKQIQLVHAITRLEAQLFKQIQAHPENVIDTQSLLQLRSNLKAKDDLVNYIGELRKLVYTAAGMKL